MRIAVCPGSFDPVTKGHLDIITRACGLFDRVIVAVSVNADKSPSFTFEERVALIQACTAHLPNLEVDVMNELLANYVRRVGAAPLSKDCAQFPILNMNFRWRLRIKSSIPMRKRCF